MTKEELIEALRELSKQCQPIVDGLNEHLPEWSHGDELKGASEIMLEWANGIDKDEIINE